MTYGGSKETSLDSLRYQKFKSKAAMSITAVQLRSLPPTPEASKYHSSRVYYQVLEWKGNTSNDFYVTAHLKTIVIYVA